MHGRIGQGLDGTGSPCRLPDSRRGSSSEKAISTMELPKRHATSLAGSRFGPLDLPLVLQLARAQCANMNRFREKSIIDNWSQVKIPFCVKCAVRVRCPGALSRRIAVGQAAREQVRGTLIIALLPRGDHVTQ